MLILTREKEQTIMIVDIRGSKVRLGISAPESMPVHRQEVYEAIQNGKRGSHGEETANQKP